MLLREAILCAGQAVVDRNVAGVRGRMRGYRAARRDRALPGRARARAGARGALETLRRRARRRSPAARARRRDAGDLRTLAVFHLADTSGPSRSLEAELSWLAGEGSLDVVLPGPGSVGDVLGEAATACSSSTTRR